MAEAEAAAPPSDALSTEDPRRPNPDPEMTEKERYFEALKTWLHQVQMSQANACLPYYFMACQMLFNAQPPVSGQFLNNNYQQQGQWPYYQLPQNPTFPRPPPNANAARNNRRERPVGIRYHIPPIWKRFVAEFLDFLFIFFSKAIIQYLTVDYFGLVGFDQFNVLNTMNLLKQITEDQDFGFELTTEIFLTELLNRLGACFFETIFLSDIIGGPILGATPGKLIMGLRVVTATSITPVENRDRETILVSPGSNITFRAALARSVIKNALITLVFPVCMFTHFYQYNRATYDVLCNVIVVESQLPVNY